MAIHHSLREPYAPDVEFVERKGAAHPDTICDTLAERMGIRIALHFRERLGGFRHFNVDKALLSAGAVDVGWGGGHTTQKSRLILAGKADLRVEPPDVEALESGARSDLEELAPGIGDSIDVEVWLNASSEDLLPVLSGQVASTPLANDTSFAVVSLERSPLESAVLAASQALDAASVARVLPLGRDIKVMGYRHGGTVAMTVAAAMLATQLTNRDQYDEAVAQVRQLATDTAQQVIGGQVDVAVNQGDDAGMPYLTLTGTSAEAGDDGQVGRGNRFGGLITPHRPMSMEACAGKNPVAHVGKTYHAVAWDTARHLLDAGAGETTVRILSKIGNPITEPEVVDVETTLPIAGDVIDDVVTEALADWRGVAQRLIDGAYPVV